MGERSQELTKAEATRVRHVESAVRRHKAIKLRARGLTYDEIGEELEINTGSARNLVERFMKKIAKLDSKEVSRLRAIDLLSLDDMQIALLTRAIGGDVKAIEATLKIMERRAKLAGLDIAQKHEISGAVEHVLTTASRKRIEELEEQFIDVVVEPEQLEKADGNQ